MELALPGCLPREIAATQTKPGLTDKGIKMEDMYHGDKPSTDDVFIDDDFLAIPNWDLFQMLEELITNVSTGRNETIAQKMLNHFRDRRSGEFKDATLNLVVRQDVSYIIWQSNFIKDLHKKIQKANGNICDIEHFDISAFAFDKFADKWEGLGIMIHQVQAIKVEVLKFNISEATGMYTIELKFHLYDDFGLDKADVIKGHNRKIQPPGTEDAFKAWWVLQHYRDFPPFITHIEVFQRYTFNIHNAMGNINNKVN